jgi:hypothetical protein
MRFWDAAGFLASCLVVLAFCMRDVIPLRLVALASNVAFLSYGIGLGLVPVWLLHAILMPINGWRLWQAISRYRGAEAQPRTLPKVLPSRRLNTKVCSAMPFLRHLARSRIST